MYDIRYNGYPVPQCAAEGGCALERFAAGELTLQVTQRVAGSGSHQNTVHAVLNSNIMPPTSYVCCSNTFYLIVLLTDPHILPLVLQLRQLDAWYRDETDRWAAERDQLAKKCAQLEQRHVQFQHELRRKDTEFEKLQKQLAARLGAAAGAGGSSSRRSVSRSGSSSSGTQVTGKLTTSSRWACRKLVCWQC
jgi:hypothetical protein